ncbi:MAG: hypothetical protein M1368_08000 [Thaumarchaeota archaeon]|nr:hypothetical protein [Nitrososphaerota archaeon]
MSDKSWMPSYGLITILVILQALSVLAVWTLNPMGKSSQQVFALFTALNLLSFAIISHSYRMRRGSGRLNGGLVLSGLGLILFLLVAGLFFQGEYASISSITFEITLLVFVHIIAAISWIGAHFFEALILHVSLKNVPARAKYEAYSKILFRFNKITGVAATTTLYAGVLLATAINFGNFKPMVTTAWGILSTLFAIFLLIGLLAPLKPKMVSNIFNLALVTASMGGIAALVSIALSLELGTLLSSSWGMAIVSGALIAIVLLIIGATQGIKRVQIAILSSQIIAGQGGEDAVASLEKIEKKMIRMVIPENIVALIVIALMVYAANPF